MNIGFSIIARNEKNDFATLKDTEKLNTITKNLVATLKDDGIQPETIPFVLSLVQEKLVETYRKLAGTGVKCSLVCYADDYRAVTPIDSSKEIEDAVTEDIYGAVKSVFASQGILVR